MKRRGNVVLKDLKEAGLLPPSIGGRATEVHDYPLAQARKWIGKVLKTNN